MQFIEAPLVHSIQMFRSHQQIRASVIVKIVTYDASRIITQCHVHQVTNTEKIPARLVHKQVILLIAVPRQLVGQISVVCDIEEARNCRI